MTLTFSPRPVLRGGVLAVAFLTLAACGGIADDAPSNADLTEFCNTYYDEESTAQEVAQKLAGIGTPDDISDAERNGFEVYVDGLEDEGDSPNKDVDEVQIPADDKADGQAFVTYAGEACSTIAPTDPSADPSEPAPETSTP